MKFPNHISCLLLLSVGTSFLAHGLRAPKHPGEEEFQVIPDEPGFGEAGHAEWRRSTVGLNPLFSIAKELQSFGKEKAGIQFRFGRQDADEEPKAIADLLEEGGEKGAGRPETLAGERNGDYKRKKTVFSIWFGRRKGEAFWAKGSFSGGGVHHLM
ncbi:orexigenic neuropeptide QRFP [Pseudonaja textilis]|uniref:Pyroglutamylated RFamide peptide n=1 Tax=Pseudonaja textilis TaxID=8673 RepID=A0A670ZFH7_PSETE|nr:orexigenic neuropeptide QRFP [Pseudonaja textilis]